MKMSRKLCLLLLVFRCHFLLLLGQNVQFYKLVLQWPISFCNGDIWCQATVPTDDFKIHGLRHFNANWSIVKNCGVNGLRRDELNEIREQLQREWPNLKGKNMDFWKEQWRKHGTCSGINPLEYFQFALGLKSRYRLLSHFRFIGCEPAEHVVYTSGDIRDIIYNKYGRIPEIKCNKNGRDGHQLFEVTFCFDNLRSPIDCDFNDSDCPSKRVIIFPSKKTLAWHWLCPDRDIIFPPEALVWHG